MVDMIQSENKDLALTLNMYAEEYCKKLNDFLEREIKSNFNKSVRTATLISFYLTHDILSVSKRDITYRNLFSLMKIQNKNMNCIVDIEILQINLKPLLINIFNINKFQAIGWMYIMHVNEIIVLNHYKSHVSQLPDIRLKRSIKLGIRIQNNELRSFNRKLSTIDLDDKHVAQICSGIDQASYRLSEIFRKYHD